MLKYFAVVFSIAMLALPASAQDTAKQTEEILEELRQIRVLLETKLNAPSVPNVVQAQAPTTPPVTIDVGNAPFLGSKEAPLTIVEFTDFQCPFCNRFYLETFPDLKRNYIDSQQVRFYSMDFPLDIHGNALLAAQAGRCAGDQSLFWAMHDRMQSKPQQLELKNLLDYARDTGLDMKLFRDCLETEKYKADIQQGNREAMSKAVRGTPTFVIGKSTATGVDGTMVVGAQPYEVFDKMLKNLVH